MANNNDEKPRQSENPIANEIPRTNETLLENSTPNDLYETLQNLDNTIVDIVESLQVVRNTEDQLNSDESEKITQTKKDMGTSLDFAQDLIAKMQEKTFSMIERDHGTEALREAHCYRTPVEESCNSTEDFYNVLVLKHGSSTHHNIMLLDSKAKFEGMNSNSQCSCVPESDSKNDSDFNCANSSANSNENVLSDSSCESVKSNNSRLKNEVSALKECLKNIIAENQDLRFKLNTAVKQNDSMEIALKLPAPFKYSSDGSIRFPGKKEMEKKILLLKTELLKLHVEIKEIQSIKQNLKSAKQCIKQYDAAYADCPCRTSSLKNDSRDTNVKVKHQQIKQIESQIKLKKEELSKIKSDYKSCIVMNDKNNAKSNELTCTLVDLKKKLQEHQSDAGNDVIKNLNTTKQEIETMELIINERTDIINDCDQKMEAVNIEIKNIIKKTDALEATLRNLFDHFKDAYNELESAYQEQSEEIMMLPAVLKVTHIKLQEETDLRVLAEESKNKLKRAIKNAEETKKPVPVQDESSDEEFELLMDRLETENKKLESMLESLGGNISLASTELTKETEHLETLKKEVEDTVVESTRHVKAFDDFATIHTDGIVKNVEEIQKLLMELQGKECTKFMIKRKVMDYLRKKIDSINKNVEECKSQISKFYNQ